MASALGDDDDDFSRFCSIPMSALNVSSRLRLSNLLNVEQALSTHNSIARDYRGLAELMDFDYPTIRNFQRGREPTNDILEAWSTRPGSSVGHLLRMISQLERYDVLEETLPLVDKDVEAYTKRRRNMTAGQRPVQVDEVSTCQQHVIDPTPDDPNILTVDDSRFGLQYYDAYVCYADGDLDFVTFLAEQLETSNLAIKLFIRDRDLRLGVLQYDAFVRLVEKRCKRVLVILSPEFLQSAECEFQSKFAAGLGVEQRSVKIIPIIYKHCDQLPSLFSLLSKVNLSAGTMHNWAWKKIVKSLKPEAALMTSPSSQPIEAGVSPQRLQLPSNAMPAIASSSRTASPIVEEFYSSDISVASEELLIPHSSGGGATFASHSSNGGHSPAVTPRTKKKWFSHIKNPFH